MILVNSQGYGYKVILAAYITLLVVFFMCPDHTNAVNGLTPPLISRMLTIRAPREALISTQNSENRSIREEVGTSKQNDNDDGDEDDRDAEEETGDDDEDTETNAAEGNKINDSNNADETANKNNATKDDAEADEDSSEEDDASDKQTAAVSGDETSYSFWGIVRSVWNWIRDDFSDSFLGDDATTSVATKANSKTNKKTNSKSAVEGRTFGKIRRLQMALIPIVFKFGVISAMVAFLVMLGMKTLFLVKVLVAMNAIAILAKFLTFKGNFGHSEHSAPIAFTGYSNWNPHVSSGWSSSAPASSHPSKEIHLHIHGGQLQQPQISGASSYGAPQQSHGWERRNDPYAAYAAYEPQAAAPSSEINEINVENELNNQGPIAMLPTKYPANHRY